MAVAINPDARETYVLIEDRDLADVERTEFILRPVTAGEFNELCRRSGGDLFLGDLALAGICGWTNLRGSDDKQVAYSEAAAKNRLSPRWLREIAAAVARLSRLAEPDEKNSVSPQPSSAAQ